MRRTTRTLFLVAVVGLLSLCAAGQQITASTSININANLPESLTVSATALPGPLALNLTGASAPETSAITTSWVLKPSRAGVAVYASFANSAQALSFVDGAATAYLQSGLVFGRCTTGTHGSFSAFTENTPVAGASFTVFSENLGGANKNKSRSDNLDLEIDLSSAPAGSISAGNYSGVINILATSF